MAVFIGSDLHFFHKRIIELQPRPFESLLAMHEVLIGNWNRQVGPKDHVYVVGDFSFGNSTKTLALLAALNGHIHLIKGNHDHDSTPVRAAFASYHQDGQLTVHLEGHWFTFNHYPMEMWYESHKGALHCFGHSHGSYANPGPPRGRRQDVGIDTRGLTLYPIEEIIENLMKKDILVVDRHAPRERKVERR